MATTRPRAPRLPASDRFAFHDPIGVGGAGAVYRGLDRTTGLPVALKVLRRGRSEDPDLHERLAREFRAAARLDHPNIVRAVALEYDGETGFAAFELADGGNLVEWIDRHGPFPEADAVRVTAQVAQALDYAHRRQVVHRDVKPENVLLLPDGRARLTDFGLAKDYGRAGGPVLTLPASALGTLHYMAPEQFEDARSAGQACDVYSLAATLYTLLTGELPFDAKTPLAVLARKATGPAPSARAVAVAVSPHVDAAIRAGLDPDPDRRPASCLELCRLLATGRPPAGRPTPARPAAGPDRRGSARAGVAIGGCVVIAASDPPSEWAEERWPLTVRDVSAGGAGVVLGRRFEPGTPLAVELAGEPPVRFAARVAWVRADGMGHWVHGCAFARPLSAADLSQFMGRV